MRAPPAGCLWDVSEELEEEESGGGRRGRGETQKPFMVDSLTMCQVQGGSQDPVGALDVCHP